MHTRVIACLVFVLISSPALLGATIIFSDNFESYAPGSNLIGQNGWTGENGPGEPGPPIVTINTATHFLTTRVVDGRAITGPGEQHIAEHFVPINPGMITTLMFDADALPTYHNQFVAIDAFGLGVGDRVQWGIDANVAQPGWHFGPGEAQGNEPVAGGINQKVELGIVLDGPANQVYGLYNFDGGPMEQTAHYVLSDARHATLNAVHIYIDTATTLTGRFKWITLLFRKYPSPQACR